MVGTALPAAGGGLLAATGEACGGEGAVPAHASVGEGAIPSMFIMASRTRTAPSSLSSDVIVFCIYIYALLYENILLVVPFLLKIFS